MYCDTPLAGGTIHDVKAFGPVSTLIHYDGVPAPWWQLLRVESSAN